MLFVCLFYLFFIANSLAEVSILIMICGFSNGTIYSSFWPTISYFFHKSKDTRLTVSKNAFGTAYGILQVFCNLLQTIFPIVVGQLIDTAPTKRIGFNRAAGYLLLLVAVSFSLALLLVKKDKKYSSKCECEDEHEKRYEVESIELVSIYGPNTVICDLSKSANKHV